MPCFINLRRYAKRALLLAFTLSLASIALGRLTGVRLEPATQAATVFSVTNTNDSGAGSLRQAILDANANSGTDTIVFNIPAAGVQTISLSTVLPTITDPVLIDGYTQPGAKENTLANGNDAVLLIELDGRKISSGATGTPGLTISAGSSKIRGLAIYGFGNGAGIQISQNGNNVIEGNFIGTNAGGNTRLGNVDGVNITFSTGNLIGGTTPAARNVISGNAGVGVFSVTNASGNTIQGNFIGTNAAGTTALGNNSGGISCLDQGNDLIGGTTDGARNVISGNINNAGVLIQSGSTGFPGVNIQGNYIGTDVTGTIAIGNFFGIWLNHGSNAVVGGTTDGARNLISGNRSNGILIGGGSDALNNQILGNFIGTDVSGTLPLGNKLDGVRISDGATRNRIGNTTAGAGNTIAFNSGAGVSLLFSGTGNSIRRNSIFSNGGLGIDLGADGAVTPNDAGDADTGPNNLQNFPVISSATSDGAQTIITGTLNSTPNTNFNLEFFTSSAADPSGNGEGTKFFAATAKATDASGNMSFNLTLPFPLPIGQTLTATATDPTGNTSEFSAADASKAAGSVQFSAAQYKVIEDVGFATITVTRTGGSSGPLSVDYSTQDGTAISGQDYTPASGTLNFAEGETTKTFTIQILDDTVTEQDETVNLILRNASNVDSLGSQPTATLVIQDHNTVPVLTINSASGTEGNPGAGGSVTFTVSLSAATGRTVTVDYRTDPSNATPGVDYQAVTGTLTFNPREQTKTLAVPLIGDALDEFDETFRVVLTNAVGATTNNNAVGTGTIVDDDDPPTLSINDISVNEGNSGITFALFTLTLSAPSGKTINVQYNTSDGTAKAGSDYSASSPLNFVTFTPGTTTSSIQIQIFGDTQFEPDETFFVNLLSSQTSNVTITKDKGTCTILNDDVSTLPAISIGEAAVSDSNGNTNAVFTVQLSAASDQTVKVDYATANGTATAGSDYQAVSGTLTFNPGTTTQTITVPVIGDALTEGSENFFVNLTNPVGATISDNQGMGTITDGPPSTLPWLSVNDITIQEGDSGTTSVDFTVTLSQPSNQTVGFSYTLAPGTATENVDYMKVFGAAGIGPGATSTRISVPIVGDKIDEFDETFFINLSSATNATIADAQGMGTILDNDPPPTISISDSSVDEGNSGTTSMVFNVTLSSASAKPISVDFSTGVGTATPGADYVATSGTVTLNPGEVTKNILVTVNGDTLNEVEPNETFTVNLTNPVNVTIADGQGVGNIIDYVMPSLQFSSDLFNANESAGQVTITIQRTGSLLGALTVDYATVDVPYAPCTNAHDQARQNCDYITTTGTLTFAQGESNKTFTVLLIDDAYVEDAEPLNLALSNPTGATLGATRTARLSIQDNDTAQPTFNPSDDAQFFTRQHYFDFLNRQADQGGLDYWSAQITQCGTNQSCINNKRIDVSNAFFFELEYQQTAAYVFRLYRAAFGNNQPFPNPDTSNPAESKKLPAYDVFSQDRARVVGGTSLASWQLALANLFTQRTEFLSKYPANLDGPSFVDAILSTIKNDSGVDLSSQRTALISLFNTDGRGAVLYRLADDNAQSNPINNRAFIDAEYNRAFVYSQYSGYLRRDADIGGFLFWLGQVNSAALRDVAKQHAMVCSFITSAEYQMRFSSVVTHSNQECPQ